MGFFVYLKYYRKNEQHGEHNTIILFSTNHPNYITNRVIPTCNIPHLVQGTSIHFSGHELEKLEVCRMTG